MTSSETVYTPKPEDDLVFQPVRPFTGSNSQAQFSARLQTVRRLRRKLYLARAARGEDATPEFPCQCRDTTPSSPFSPCSCSCDTRDVFADNHAMPPDKVALRHRMIKMA